VVALACANLLGGCAAPAGTGTADPVFRGQWQLQAATDADGPFDLQNAKITLTVSDDPDATGRSTCADYRAEVFGTPASVRIQAATTSLSSRCPTEAAARLESRYFAALGAVRHASVSGEKLELSSGEVTLYFLTPLPAPVANLANRRWQLIGIDGSGSMGKEFTTVANDATFQFFSDKSFVGTTGCRYFSGRYRLDAGALVATTVTPDEVACDPELEMLDGAMLAVFDGAFTATPEDGAMVIANQQSGVALQFWPRREAD
jgi:heat shock protein HslJ